MDSLTGDTRRLLSLITLMAESRAQRFDHRTHKEIFIFVITNSHATEIQILSHLPEMDPDITLQSTGMS